MTQEEKLLARIKSLDPGMTTLRIFKDSSGNMVLWVVEETQKVEGYAPGKLYQPFVVE